MNKTKSGVPARFKAALVAPFAILIFFLFADFTLKGSEGVLTPVNNELSGLWVNQGDDNFSETLLIRQNRISYTDGMEIREYFLRKENGSLVLSESEGSRGIQFRYELEGEELIFWWNDSHKSSYQKSKAWNTLDHYLENQDKQMEADLPSISQYRLLDENLVYRICYGKDSKGVTALTFNGRTFNLKDLGELVEKEKSQLSKFDQRSSTALFLVDRSIPMVLVDQLRHELRKSGNFHVAEGGYPHGDLELSPLLYHVVALPRLLPPLDAKIMDKKEVEKRGGKVHTIDLSARNTTPRDVDEGLRKFIAGSPDGKYLISLEYDKDIPYGQYVETVDMIYNVVYSFRIALAEEKYGVPYDKLGDELQRELRKVYPMALSESMK